MKINRKYMAGLLILAVFALSCGKKNKSVEDNSRPVKVQVLEDSGLSLGYTASGVLKGIEEIPYTATAGGTVVAINAQNGDAVNEGQVIVSIDNQSARSGVKSAQANVNVASSNINSARANLEEARINYEKYRQLYDKRLVTETEYLSAKTAYNSASANLSAMESNLSSAQANLDTANDTDSKSTIAVNRSGVIASMSLEKYQQVSSGDALFTLVNEDEMKMEVGVSPQIINKITVGTEAKIKIDELNNREVTGTVYEVSASANSSTRQFTVKVRIPNPDKEIKSGMYGTVNINTGVEEGIVIPKNAIVIRGVEQIVYIVKDGKAVAIPIKISNQNDAYAAVTGEGLAAGVELVVDGQNVLQANEKVRKVQ